MIIRFKAPLRIINKALFLDRDGVINADEVYTCKISDFAFTSFIFDTVLSYQQQGYIIIVITQPSWDSTWLLYG